MGENRYTLFVGNLPRDMRSRELKDLFSRYDPTNVELRNSRTSGSCFGYVEFKHKRDARDALYKFDGYDFDGYRLRVDYKKALEPKPSLNGNSRLAKPIKEYSNLCKIHDLPNDMSWRDLKIFLKMYCTSECCEIDKGVGYVAFYTRNDMNHAIRKFNKNTFTYNEKPVPIKLEMIQGKNKSRSRSKSNSLVNGGLNDD